MLTRNCSGFALKATSVTDWLAIIVLCVHIALALAHTIWIFIFQSTSDSWDGVDELLALVWNSEPNRGAPSNTCSGIKDWRTLSAKVCVRVVEPNAGQGTEMVQLVAADQSQGLADIAANTAYGAKT